MLRIRENEDNPGQVIIAGEIQTKTEKKFECTECGRGITYFTVSPLRCPFCDRGLPDITRILGAHGEGDRVYFHRMIKKAEFE